MKVKWMLDALGRDYQWVPVDIMSGDSRTPDFLLLNPSGQVPVVVLEDGRALAQSNAILLHLAEGTRWIPADAWERARMLEWMFWEQYSHEPYVAVARFQRVYAGRTAEEVEPGLIERGHAALARMEVGLAGSDWLAGGVSPSLADIALVAYTRVAHEGGFDMSDYPNIRAWIARVEAVLGLG